METRFCLGNIQMPFLFGPWETFWNLPDEKQKTPQAWVCVFVGASQLLRAKKNKEVQGSVLVGCKSRWRCSSVLLSALSYCLQKKLNGKFIFQATNEKTQCFMFPVLYSKFTVVDQVNSSWPCFLDCSLVYILRGKATCFSNLLQYLHFKEGNIVWSPAPVLNCLPVLTWQFCHIPISLS